jgi:hypothetical protein
MRLKGKVAIVMRRVPQQGNPHGRFSDPKGGMSQYAELRTKLDRAFAKGAVAVLFVNDPYSGRNELEQAKKQVAKLAQGVADAAEEFEAVDSKDAEKLAAARKKLTEEVAKYKSGKGHLGKEEPDTLMKFGYAGHDAIRNLPVLHITRAVCDQVLKPALNKTLAEIETEIDKETLACQGYGFYDGTPEFAACMKFVSRERSKRTSTLVPQPQGPPVTCQTNGSVTNCQSR